MFSNRFLPRNRWGGQNVQNQPPKLALATLLIVCFLAPLEALAVPTISGISASGVSAGLYEKFELTFGVDTVATNPYWPYDPNPAANVPEHPNAVPAGVGVSVDGLFLPPDATDWDNAIVQPGFYYQEFLHEDHSTWQIDRDWLYAVEDPCWKIRFAPTIEGDWRYKIRVTDADGTVYSDDGAFMCVLSTNHGFIRVSKRDPRYFETSDDSYVNLMGCMGYNTSAAVMDAMYSSLGGNGVNLVREFWNAAQGPVISGVMGDGGMPGWGAPVFSGEVVRPGEIISGKITTNKTDCAYVDVEPSASYRFSVWVKTVGVTGTGNYGVCLRAYPVNEGEVPLTSYVNGNTDWTEIAGTFTVGSTTKRVSHLKISVENITDGTVYYTDISVKKVLGDGNYGPELMSRTSYNAHMYVSQHEAWKADYQVESAKRNGVYLKLCLQEKHDRTFAGIQADGSYGARDDNNIYAAATHACRVYQRYLFRYIAARWGYATSIHSFEFLNEGDPFSNQHYHGAQAFAAEIHSQDPNKHLCTTTFWTNFPSKEFWTQPAYSDIDYVDIHQYIGKALYSGDTYLQYVDGWWDNDHFDTTQYRSAPTSIHLVCDGGECKHGELEPIPVVPGHVYRVSAYLKGDALTQEGSQQVGTSDWIYPSMSVTFKDGYWGDVIPPTYYPGDRATMLGTYDWTLLSTANIAAPANARYLIVNPQGHWAVGNVWFDDISILDVTTNEYLDINGNFDLPRIDHDSALMARVIGRRIGVGLSRVVDMPVIRGENGISGDNVYGDPYKGIGFTGENQQLIDDTEGIWFRKFVWGHINPFGVISLYWWTTLPQSRGLFSYVKAYQNFMAGIDLSNGHYEDAKAVCSTSALRAWGQKDITANKAHLWIDNAPRTWHAVVSSSYTPTNWSSTVSYGKDATCGYGNPVHIYRSKQASNKNHLTTDTTWWEDVGPYDPGSRPSVPGAVSGTVTIEGLANGSYSVESWDTSTGQITRIDTLIATGGSLQIFIQSLQSDLACKIYPSPAKIRLEMTVPQTEVFPHQVVNVTLRAYNEGETAATNLHLTTTIPLEMEYVTGSAEASGGTYDQTNRIVSWVISTLAAGPPVERVFSAEVK